MTPLTKVCGKCGIEKELSEFHKNKNYRLGVTAQCKPCRMAAVRQWRKLNPEKCEAARLRYQATEKCKEMWKRAREKQGPERRKRNLDKWRAENPDRIRFHALNRILKRRGISREEYDALVAKQNNRCAICGEPEARGELLAIDHCHATGKNRGLLCEKHNLMLGLSGDSPVILRKAAEYLESHKGD